MMGYYRVLRILYNDNLESIINLLNDSVYITNYEDEGKSFIIHTGFSFSTQTGQELEVLYSISSKITIIQPRNPGHGFSYPKLNGLNLLRGGYKNEVYFNTLFPMITYEFHYKNEERFSVMPIDNDYISKLWDKSEITEVYGINLKDNSKIRVCKIKVFIKKNGKTIKESYPLNRTLRYTIFLNPDGWIYDLDKY